MTVVTLCGSSRFPDAHMLAQMHEALMGNVVIPMSLYGHADFPEGAEFLTSDGDESTPEKQGLDELHLRKIDLADEVLVVNVGGYVGSSTRREIEYAREHGKPVRFLFPTDDELEAVVAEDELASSLDVRNLRACAHNFLGCWENHQWERIGSKAGELKRALERFDPPCSGSGFAHAPHGSCPGYSTDRT